MTVDVQILIDAAAEENLAPSTYLTQWNEFAEWQMDTLMEQGLKPSHRLLDLGCGALRLASLVVPYLDEGNYYGIDPNRPMLDLGKNILNKLNVPVPNHLIESGDFAFDRFGVKFDYAIAQSVITHFSQEQIEECVRKLAPTMQANGNFIFTYFLTQESPRMGFLFSGVEPMVMPCLRDETIFHRIAADLDIKFSVLKDKHPSQKAAMFIF